MGGRALPPHAILQQVSGQVLKDDVNGILLHLGYLLGEKRDRAVAQQKDDIHSAIWIVGKHRFDQLILKYISYCYRT
jgi:hypothetical protein